MVKGIHVSLSAPDAGVFESQVLEFGRFLGSIGVALEYLLFEGVRTGIQSGASLKRKLADLERRFDTRLELRYLPGPLSPLGLRLAGYHVARRARSFETGRVLVHARGAPAACAAVEARRQLDRIAVLYDARGDEAAEARLGMRGVATPAQQRRWERRAKRLELLQRRATAEADHVLTVSTALSAKLCALAKVSPDRTTVVPCCVNRAHFVRPESMRDSVRQALGLQERFVFVYSGSLQAWQIPEQVAALIRAVCAQMPSAHLLLLTQDRAGAARCFGDLVSQGRATVESCPFERVGDFLAAADAALLLREDDAVNRVACPVKFAEYQVCGLPVVATHGIGDVSDYIARSGHGVLIRLDESPRQQASQVVAAVHADRWRDRAAIAASAERTFSREHYRGAYEKVLSQLAIRTNGHARPRVSAAAPVAATVAAENE